MSKSILAQLDNLLEEMDDITAVIEKTETFRSFNKWIQERHTDSNIVCEINKYEDLFSIDRQGTIIKADNLLQIRYVDDNKRKNRGARPLGKKQQGDSGAVNH
jgi:hypothetical protein